MKHLAWLLIPLIAGCGVPMMTPMVTTTTPSGTVTETPQKVAIQQSISANQAACYARLDAQASNSLAIPEDMTGTEYALVAMANAFQTLAESLRPATDPCAVSNMADVDIAKQEKWKALGVAVIDGTTRVITTVVPWKYGADIVKAGYEVAGDVTTTGDNTLTTTFEEGTIGGSSGPAGDGAPGGSGEVADAGGGDGGVGGNAAEAGAGTTGGSTGGSTMIFGRNNGASLAGNDAISATGTKSGNAENFNDSDGIIAGEGDNNVNASVTVPVGGQ